MKSYLKNVEDIFGEFKGKEVYSFYGLASIGKTLYLIGEAVNALANGVRVIWIDTEGGWEGIWDNFAPKYAKRFNYDMSKLDELFEYKRVLSVEELAAYLGMEVEIEYGGKIKATLKKMMTKEDNTIYEKFGKKRDKVMIILDSFSSPFKMQFTTGVEQFSSRADVQSIIMMGLMRFMEKTNAILLASHHSSFNPTNVWQQTGNIRGGNTVLYYSKHVIDFEKPKKKALDNFRKIYGVRTSKAKNWEKEGWLQIKDDGYYDATEDDAVAAMAGSKAVSTDGVSDKTQ